MVLRLPVFFCFRLSEKHKTDEHCVFVNFELSIEEEHFCKLCSLLQAPEIVEGMFSQVPR